MPRGGPAAAAGALLHELLLQLFFAAYHVSHLLPSLHRWVHRHKHQLKQGYGIAVFTAIIVFVLVGFASVFAIKGKSENFFVAGRSLPLWVVTATLASQSIDANALLGNATLSFKYHFWDGACLPIGLGLSLILNAIFLARFINEDHNLTLPDVFGKRYGKLVEVIASTCCITSFIFLLAGNLVSCCKVDNCYVS